MTAQEVLDAAATWTPVQKQRIFQTTDPYRGTGGSGIVNLVLRGKNMKTYYIESFAYWFLVNAINKRKARSEGVQEFGRGQVKEVRKATQDELKYFKNMKGEISEAL